MFVNNNSPSAVGADLKPHIMQAPSGPNPAPLKNFHKKIAANNPNSKIPIHQSISQHPAYAGAIRKETAERILSAHPVGCWFLRYSVSEAQVVVTRKIGPDSYEHLKHIRLEAQPLPIPHSSIDEIMNSFDIAKLVCLEGSSFLTRPFTPLLKLTFKTQEAFKKFQADWRREKISKQFKIVFQEATNSFYVPYTEKEIMALSKKYAILQKYFGNSRHNIFNGYLSLDHDLSALKIGTTQDAPSLIAEADVFFSHFEPKSFEASIKPSDDPIELIQALLRDHPPGLLIGETHEHSMPKAVLINHMKILKQDGVEILFLEHLNYDVIQKDLDEYNSNPSKKMPVVLMAYLEALDSGFGLDSQKGYTALVAAAKKAGIRVVALETAASASAGYDKWYGSDGPDRMKAMNYQAKKIISKEAKTSKYIALVGSTHVSTTYKIPGLSEILGCPNMVILDSKANTVSLQTQVTDYLPQEFRGNTETHHMGGHIHFLVHMPLV